MMRPVLITFDDVDAVGRFADAIFNMENGKGITVHLASKEIDEFAEKYLAKRSTKKSNPIIDSDYDKQLDPMGYFGS